MNTIESRRIWSLKDFSSGILQRWNSTKDQSWAHQICKESRYTLQNCPKKHFLVWSDQVCFWGAKLDKSLQHRKNYLDTNIQHILSISYTILLYYYYITTTYSLICTPILHHTQAFYHCLRALICILTYLICFMSWSSNFIINIYDGEN